MSTAAQEARIRELEDVLRKIANRRPNQWAAATAFHRCRLDAQVALRPKK